MIGARKSERGSPRLHLDPASEAEIVEELAQHLEDQFRELRYARNEPMTRLTPH